MDRLLRKRYLILISSVIASVIDHVFHAHLPSSHTPLPPLHPHHVKPAFPPPRQQYHNLDLPIINPPFQTTELPPTGFHNPPPLRPQQQVHSQYPRHQHNTLPPPSKTHYSNPTADDYR